MTGTRRAARLAGCVILAALAAGVAQAQTSAQYRATLAPSESVQPAPVLVAIRARDGRQFQRDSSPLAPLLDDLAQRYEASGAELPVAMQERLKAAAVTLDVSFYGFLRSESGAVSARSAIELQVADPLDGSTRLRRAVTFDEYLGKVDLRKARSRAPADARLLAATRSRLTASLDSALAGIRSDLKVVTATGVTRIDDRAQEELLRAAALDALRAASARVWGLDVETTAKLVDLADYSESTQARTSGVVLGYEVHQELTKRTSDGMLVVSVTALLARPRGTR